MKVISVGMLNASWGWWNKKALRKLNGKTVLVVNEREDRIVAKIKFLKPPKTFTSKKIYRLYENENGGEKK